MGGKKKNRRKGSSTRAHKVLTQPIAQPAKKTDVDTKKKTMLEKLEKALTSGVSAKGKPMTEGDITKTKTRIANLESSLGIVHAD